MSARCWRASTSRASPMRSTRSRRSSAMTSSSRLSPLRRIPVLDRRRFRDQRFLGDLRLSRRGLSRPAAVPRRRQGPRPRPLARGIRRHPARRRVHLGLVLPEDRAPAGVGRAGRRGADRKPITEDIPGALDYLEPQLPARRLPVRRDRRRRHRDRELLPQRRLCRVRDRRRALAADRRVRRARTLAHPASPRCCRSRTSSAAPRSGAGARRCSTRARRWPRRRWGCANRGGG